MRNLVSLSGSLPFSLERIISSMSPWSFSITTNTFSGVSNIHSRFTMPRWRKLWQRKEGGGENIGKELDYIEIVFEERWEECKGGARGERVVEGKYRQRQWELKQYVVNKRRKTDSKPQERNMKTDYYVVMLQKKFLKLFFRYFTYSYVYESEGHCLKKKWISLETWWLWQVKWITVELKGKSACGDRVNKFRQLIDRLVNSCLHLLVKMLLY